MNKNIAITLGVIVIAGIGFFVFSGATMKNKNVIVETGETQTFEEIQNESIESSEISTTDRQVSQESKTESEVPQKSVETTKGSYDLYSPEKIALAENGDVVLFFHASWCPSCRGLNSDIEKNISTIPSGVTILKIDYDKETELKKKYGVTSQHTLVQVDKDGNLIKKWTGGGKLENLLSQIR